MTLSPRGALLALMCSVLAACGGGGGDPPAQNPTPAPPPVMSTLTLDETNAVDAAALVFGALDKHSTISEAPVIGAALMSQANQLAMTVSCFGGPIGPGVVGTIAHRYTDVDGNGRVSAGDVVRTQSSCFGVTRTITLNLTLFTALSHVEGTVSYTAVTDGGASISGSFALVSRINGPLVEQTLSNLAFTVTMAGAMTSVLDATLVRMRTDTAYEYSLTGRARDALGREFSFATPQPLTGVFTETPATGELVLTGGVTKARFVPALDPTKRATYFNYQVDPAGTEYGPVLLRRWKLVTDGTAFGWDTNAPPVIESLTLSPSAPRVSHAIAAAYVATDLDNDPLEYHFRWSVGPDTWAEDVTTLPPGRYDKGDVVTFWMSASDGKATTFRTESVTVVNTPPTGSIRIEPVQPTSSTDIVVFADSGDPDGDVPTRRFEWSRNGVLLTSQTGQTLPYTAFAKNDAITVVTVLDDGDDETRLSLETIVADTPAQLLVPTDVTGDYGDLVTFDITWSDVDPMDTFPGFVLTHGPAGMTVNRTTGEVRWLANGPMFGEDFSASWGVALDLPGAARAEGLVGIGDPGHAYPLMRTGMAAPLPLGLAAGDFNGDGRDEALVVSGGAVYELGRVGLGYEQTWSYPFAFEGEPGFAAVTFADVNRADGTTGTDGRAELFVASPFTLLKLDGVARRYTSANSFQSVWNLVLRDLAVADLDGDGRRELIVLETLDRSSDSSVQSRLTIMRADTMDGYRRLDETNLGSSFDIGNVDGDPALEIVTGGGYVIDGVGVMSYAPDAIQRKRAVFGAEIDVGDTNGDAVAEIVASVDDANVLIYQYDASTQNYNIVVTIPKVDTDALLLANVAGSAANEIVVADGARATNGYVHVYQRTGPSTAGLIFSTPSGGSGVPAIVAGDFDDDGALELLWGAGGLYERLMIAEVNGGGGWTSVANPHVASGPFAGGEVVRVPGGGALRQPIFAAIGTGDGGLRVAAMHPTTGEVTVGNSLQPPVSAHVRVRALDFDRDGGDEVFVAADTVLGAYEAAYDMGGGIDFLSAARVGEPPATALAYGDLNSDGREDLVTVGAGGVVRAVDVFARAPLFQMSLPAGQVPVAVAVGNVRGDASPEIVIAGTNKMLIIARTGSGPYGLVDTSAATYDALRDVLVTDIDGDGTREIFVLYGSSGSRVDRLDGSLTSRGGFFMDYPTSPGLSVEESAFARKNLVLYDDSTTPYIVVVDASTGTEIWRSPRLQGRMTRGGVHFVDVAGDGRRRVSVATTEGMFITR